MVWNHRVLKEVLEDGDVVYYFAEVFYDDETFVPHSWSECFMSGDTIEELEGLANRLKKALTQPVLFVDEAGNFTGETE